MSMRLLSGVVFSLFLAAGVLAAPGAEREPVVISRWTSHGPGAGGLSGLVADGQRPGAVYAATFDGRARVFASSDAGKSWTEVTDRPMLDPIPGPGLFADPQRAGVVYSRRGICYGSLCYCCVGELRRTLNAGETWEDLPGVLAAVSSVTVDPFVSETLYGLFSDYRELPSMSAIPFASRSEDGGVTWHPMPGLAKTTTGIVPDPSTPSRLYASDSVVGVLVSLDSGRTWAASNTGLDGSGIRELAAAEKAGVVYAAAEPGVFRSVDGGATWSSRDPEFSPLQLLVDPRTADTVYARTETGVFRSTDGGLHWVSLSDGLGDVSVGSLAIDSAGAFLYAGVGEEVFTLRLRPTARVPPPR